MEDSKPDINLKRNRNYKQDKINYFSPANVRLQILVLAIQDISGLYEIIWELNSEFPDIHESIKIEAAKPIIISLLESKLIELYKTKWDREKEKIMEQEHWNNIISDLNNWQPRMLLVIIIVFTKKERKLFWSLKFSIII